jgi:hypothetical protein
MPTPRLIGLVSDTHGLARPSLARALAGAELVVHAGDIGSPLVLDTLASIASVRAVRGNTDTDSWALPLPRSLLVEIEHHVIYVLHDVALLDLDPVAVGVSVVVSGHTHCASVERRDGVLYVNPGSAGPRRSALPPTVARLWIRDGGLEVESMTLED